MSCYCYTVLQAQLGQIQAAHARRGAVVRDFAAARLWDCSTLLAVALLRARRSAIGINAVPQLVLQYTCMRCVECKKPVLLHLRVLQSVFMSQDRIMRSVSCIYEYL